MTDAHAALAAKAFRVKQKTGYGYHEASAVYLDDAQAALRETLAEMEGSCWDEAPRMIYPPGECAPPPARCELRSGHGGAHKSGRIEWMHRSPYNEDARERIDRAVGGVLFNAANYPDAVQSRILGRDMSGLRGTVTEAVLAALASFHRTESHPVTNDDVEVAARAMFEEPGAVDPTSPEYMTWAEVVATDHSRADIWREDARRVLEAVEAARKDGSPT